MGGRRVADRKKRRMPCELLVGDRSHTGLVLDLSPSGLFVQTNAKTRPGQRVELRLSPRTAEMLVLRVEVVRKKVVPPRLLALAHGGVGVRILDAPSAYFTFLGELGIDRRGEERDEAFGPDEGGECEGAEGAADGLRFRVRVGQISGSRSRRIDVTAADPAAAGEAALAELGEGWKVLEVEAG